MYTWLDAIPEGMFGAVENATFMIRVDRDGTCSWSLLDQAGEEIHIENGFRSVDECRASIEDFKQAHPELMDAEVETRGSVPNI